ncbi:hypothetical protein MTR72_05790 [Bradyrhizobium sp. ISRA442]|uniref:hypothetical protein n=1 Tax=Bradyrhizobium sp. ISRA442 TaxID=2866197 RepID=UPI00311B3CA7
MKIQVGSVPIAIPLALPQTPAKSSAAPIITSSIKLAVPAVTTDVRYWALQGHPDASY